MKASTSSAAVGCDGDCSRVLEAIGDRSVGLLPREWNPATGPRATVFAALFCRRRATRRRAPTDPAEAAHSWQHPQQVVPLLAPPPADGGQFHRTREPA